MTKVKKGNKENAEDKHSNQKPIQDRFSSTVDSTKPHETNEKESEKVAVTENEGTESKTDVIEIESSATKETEWSCSVPMEAVDTKLNLSPDHSAESSSGMLLET